MIDSSRTRASGSCDSDVSALADDETGSRHVGHAGSGGGGGGCCCGLVFAESIAAAGGFWDEEVEVECGGAPFEADALADADEEVRLESDVPIEGGRGSGATEDGPPFLDMSTGGTVEELEAAEVVDDDDDE